MLNKEAHKNIKNMRECMTEIWGNDVEITYFKEFDYPFSQFEMKVKIENKYDVLITYDRSIMGIAVNINGKFEWIDDLSSKEVIGSFDSCRTKENMLYNFKILEEVLKELK